MKIFSNSKSISGVIHLFDYSITPPRYFVVVLGIWLFFSISYIFFSKKLNSKAFSLLAFFLILISVYGPQSSFTVSKKLQESRFVSLLENFKMINEGKIIKNENLSDEKKAAISNFIKYFDEYSEFNNIQILPENFEIDDMKKVFGFEYNYYYRNKYKNSDIINYYFYIENEIINISEFDYILDMSINLSDPETFKNEKIEISYDDETENLKIMANEEIYGVINIEKMVKEFQTNHDSNDINNLDEASIYYDFDNVNVKIIIENINYTTDQSYNHIKFKLLIDIR